MHTTDLYICVRLCACVFYSCCIVFMNDDYQCSADYRLLINNILVIFIHIILYDIIFTCLSNTSSCLKMFTVDVKRPAIYVL